MYDSELGRAYEDWNYRLKCPKRSGALGGYRVPVRLSSYTEGQQKTSGRPTPERRGSSTRRQASVTAPRSNWRVAWTVETLWRLASASRLSGVSRMTSWRCCPYCRGALDPAHRTSASAAPATRYGAARRVAAPSSASGGERVRRGYGEGRRRAADLRSRSSRGRLHCRAAMLTSGRRAGDAASAVPRAAPPSPLRPAAIAREAAQRWPSRVGYLGRPSLEGGLPTPC